MIIMLKFYQIPKNTKKGLVSILKQQKTELSIKQMSRLRILRYLLENGSTSRKELAENLKMSMPTVFQYVTELIDQNILSESGEYESTGGRKAKILSIKEGNLCAVGVNITKNHIVIVLVDLSGKILNNVRLRFTYENTNEYYMELGSKIQQFLDAYKAESGIDYKIMGVGFSVPGIINPDTEIFLRSHTLGISDVSLSRFSVNVPYPVTFDNDANCAAYAEINNSVTNGTLYLSLSSTVGGAVYFHNQLYPGDNFRSGEFGHMIIEAGGQQCYCGNYGCLDAYCSTHTLLENEDDSLADFFERLKFGDPACVQKFDTFLDHLAIGLSNLRMAFDCDIIIGGDVGGYLEDYIDLLYRKIRQYNIFDSTNNYLRFGHYKLLSSAIGAAKKVTDEFLQGHLF